MNENGKWITINGTHVFLKDGQSPMDAFIRNEVSKTKISDEDKRIYDSKKKNCEEIIKNAKEKLENNEYEDKERGFDSKGELERKVEYYTKFKEGLEILQSIQEKEGLKLSKSPYGESYYLVKDGEKIDWGVKPEGSYRLADHWNWNNGNDCPTATNKDFKLAIAVQKNGKYELIKELYDISTRELIWGKDDK